MFQVSGFKFYKALDFNNYIKTHHEQPNLLMKIVVCLTIDFMSKCDGNNSILCLVFEDIF